jgi:hypothetical protein
MIVLMNFGVINAQTSSQRNLIRRFFEENDVKKAK